MSVRVGVILLVVLIGLTSALELKQPAKQRECIDNTLLAKFLCYERKDGERFTVPGKCGEYFECSKGVSVKKTCPKFYDNEKKMCVSESKCVEVDNTDCIMPTPQACSGNGTLPTPIPCDCPAPPTTPPPKDCPIVTCPTARPCPSVSTCAPPTQCPKPPSCPPPIHCPKPPSCPCSPPSGGPCGNWYDPNDLYGSFVCNGKPDGIKLIALNNCNDYYYCIGGHSYLKTCGKNRYFNPKVNACDEKSSVYCPSQKNALH